MTARWRTDQWPGYEGTTADVVRREIEDYDPYSGGEIEHLRDKLNNVIGRFSDLVQLLHESGKLSDEDVRALIGRYERTE